MQISCCKSVFVSAWMILEKRRTLSKASAVTHQHETSLPVQGVVSMVTDDDIEIPASVFMLTSSTGSSEYSGEYVLVHR